jgi:hypothetical protein
LTEIDIVHQIVEREEEGIASGLWYDEKGRITDNGPLWLNNEYYAWC